MNIMSSTESVIGKDLVKELSSQAQSIGEDKSSSSFSSFLDKSLSDVNQLLQQSDQKSLEIAVGKTENLHEAMIAFEKAESAFKLLVQVRNKALDAYHEIMRMQV